MAELADAIVQSGRSTLEWTIKEITSNPEWRAEVVYGGTVLITETLLFFSPVYSLILLSLSLAIWLFLFRYRFRFYSLARPKQRRSIQNWTRDCWLHNWEKSTGSYLKIWEGLLAEHSGDEEAICWQLLWDWRSNHATCRCERNRNDSTRSMSNNNEIAREIIKNIIWYKRYQQS